MTDNHHPFTMNEESLDALNAKLAKLDREQNDHGDDRNAEEIRRLLPLIYAAERRENRLCAYLRWVYEE